MLVELLPNGGSQAPSESSATLRWDRQNRIPLHRWLSKDAVILLLTPLVIPPVSQVDITRDPFEPLGQSLAKSYPAVRHVPYTSQDGVTGVHIAFIKKADVVVFIITGFPSKGETSQLELAALVDKACGSRPLVVVSCCGLDYHEIQRLNFLTVVEATGFSAPDLRAVSTVLVHGERSLHQLTTQALDTLNRISAWSIDPWHCERDLADVHRLWTDNVPQQYKLSQSSFGALLKRDGYAMHHVVRDPLEGQIIGFCATFITFADSKGEELIGSIAVIVVRKDFQNRGIGQALYNKALNKLSNIRGLNRLLLGSTFPRLWYGIPSDHPDMMLLRGRDWTYDQAAPGTGRIMADWLLRFNEGPSSVLTSSGLTFRPCQVSDSRFVAEMAAQVSEAKHGFGWYDQYVRLLDSSHISDIILGFEGSTLVAITITYTQNKGNPTAADLPWAASIGPGIGGITCICIKGDRAPN